MWKKILKSKKRKVSEKYKIRNEVNETLKSFSLKVEDDLFPQRRKIRLIKPIPKERDRNMVQYIFGLRNVK